VFGVGESKKATCGSIPYVDATAFRATDFDPSKAASDHRAAVFMADVWRETKQPDRASDPPDSDLVHP
jgi:hypothetical protein